MSFGRWWMRWGGNFPSIARIDKAIIAKRSYRADQRSRHLWCSDGYPHIIQSMYFQLKSHSSKPQSMRRPCRHRADGFSLVEVLVSIVVLSFGLLGMVGMQAAALQSNREARTQSSGVTMARELADAIRGNKNEGIKLPPNNPYVGSFSTPLTATTASYCLNVATGTIPCTNAADIASAQMTEWLTRVDAELPGARVDICFDSAPFDANGLPRWICNATGGILVIKIGWTKGSTDKSKTGNAALERATIPSVVLPVTAGV